MISPQGPFDPSSFTCKVNFTLRSVDAFHLSLVKLHFSEKDGSSGLSSISNTEFCINHTLIYLNKDLSLFCTKNIPTSKFEIYS
jgi:hypothetical protein